MTDTTLQQFYIFLQKSFLENTFVQLNLGDYKGPEENLKKLLVKPVLIKNKEKFSFTYRYQTNDITKNYTATEALAEVKNIFGAQGFGFASFVDTNFTIEMQRLRNGRFKLKKKNIAKTEKPALAHDNNKRKHIHTTGQHYLRALGITNESGEVKKSGQDKYRQINHYIEILSSLLKDLPESDLRIVDMGSGKGYLTFALYDYVHNTLQKKAHITGVEYRSDLVDLCNQIAHDTNFESLNFVQGTIENYSTDKNITALIALHACDTATDDAIYKGIKHDAELIVVAPCCHKQIRREMKKNKAENDLDFLLKHGILLERQAEMVTDGLRALLLEYSGYSTKVFEFIATEHTPKNVLIVGKKRKVTPAEQETILEKIKARKKYFGIEQHWLEGLLGV